MDKPAGFLHRLVNPNDISIRAIHVSASLRWGCRDYRESLELARQFEAKKHQAAIENRYREIEANQLKRGVEREFVEAIRRIDTKGLLIENIVVTDSHLKIVVENAWHTRHFQERLQLAQVLHGKWLSLCASGSLCKLRFSVVDLVGNEVGGYSDFSGIWVQKH